MKIKFFLTDFEKRKTPIILTGIALIALVLVLTFTWLAGLIGQRITTKTFLSNTPESFPAGYRRAHGKGICFEGTFHASGDAVELSVAQVFEQKKVPAIGRFSLGSGNPYAPDNSSRTVSMALMLTSNDGEQWRMKLNNKPFFVTRDAVGFLKRVEAFKPQPKTGKPDPKKIAAFLKEYPEAKKFMEYDAKAPWTKSFAGSEYYVINAFLLIDSSGKEHPVRWSMRPHAPFVSMNAEEREKAGPNYLFDELKKRLEKAPLYWDLVLTIAEPGDPVNDPSRQWPANRKQIIAGTLEVNRVYDQEEGGCRDINFDPTLVPKGIALSDDPVLAARAGIYSHSYNDRVREIGYGKATDAVGKSKKDDSKSK